MTTILEHYVIFNIGSFDRWRNRSKMFWQYRRVYWVVVRKAYVEKKGKRSRMGDNANVTNPDTSPSVI